MSNELYRYTHIGTNCIMVEPSIQEARHPETLGLKRATSMYRT